MGNKKANLNGSLYWNVVPVSFRKEDTFMTLPGHSQILNNLYKENDHGYVAIFRKGFKGIYQRHYKKQDLEEALDVFFSGGYNNELYISMNTFLKPNRTSENLRYLNALYIDIDCYKLNIRKESVLFFLENDFYNKIIPEPSVVVDSGRGLYLVWFIEPVPSRALTLWRAMQYYLYSALKEFGADRAALDESRVLRVVGSYNSKSDSYVKIVDFNNFRYTLKDLKSEYLPEIKKEDKKIKKKRKSNKIHIFNFYGLHKSRMEDIYKLVQLRSYDMKGKRELILFLYRYYATLVEGETVAEEMTLELNESFIEPLPLNEINSTKSNYIGKYNYKNKTLVELLEISLEEMKHMTSLISKEHKFQRNNERRKGLRRNENGLTKREQLKKDNLIKIIKLMDEGRKTKEIAETLDISLRMVQKYKKELKENNKLYEDLKKEILSINDNYNEDEIQCYDIDLNLEEIEEIFNDDLKKVGS
uniref:Putative plasmid replication protein n=1 Tax=Clostridium botulinum TaxID=1491 RepID=A0A0A0V0E6_CLOBO|nr:replication protein [Clostridium botulinum]AIW54643.1 putative plasmid replication protein [Clostridium botulinum]AIW54892.1 putative plasmid replication protein [Clostridium botulinum]AIW54947.1 putative plasmid replication protein [Clostridium botulinum]AIW55002.1 putative plasmid replication protein [Clostridium botulinum]